MSQELHRLKASHVAQAPSRADGKPHLPVFLARTCTSSLAASGMHSESLLKRCEGLPDLMMIMMLVMAMQMALLLLLMMMMMMVMTMARMMH